VPRGDFDRIIQCELAAAECFQDAAGFSAAAAAEFHDGDGRGQAIDDVASMTPEQTLIGSRESVFGQMADDFKERRAHVIV